MNWFHKILNRCNHDWEIMNEERFKKERWCDEDDPWDSSRYTVKIMSRMYVCKKCLKHKTVTHEVNDG